uniref:EF-hand domain-containing protein n=1 Tax=Panagrolaimus sp. ES5 TaxID=591445 RepID=A0AC34GPK9_9BILA
MFRSIKYFTRNSRPFRIWQQQKNKTLKFPKPFTFTAASTFAAGASYLGFRAMLPFNSKYEEENDMKLSKRQQRFQDFASIEYNGTAYMSPQDFLDSLINDEPKERVFRRVVKEEQVKKMLKKTPPLRKGSSKLFRELGQNGIITYAEYVFMLTLLTKSQQSFNLAFLIMFDEDENSMIDKEEFLKVRSLMLSMRSEKKEIDDADCEIYPNFDYNARLFQRFGGSSIPRLLEEIISSTKEVHPILTTSQSSQIVRFYGNLQRELIEIEFQEFSRGKSEISPIEFAHLVLRYSIVDRSDQSPYIQRVSDRTNDDQGISLEQFEQFSMFLNNLDDFTKAVRLFTAADLPVSRNEFIRAVKCSTGFDLDPKLVDMLYRIFDANNDDRLSYSEFIAIMNDRLHRGFKTYTRPNVLVGWQPFRDCVIHELSVSQ